MTAVLLIAKISVVLALTLAAATAARQRSAATRHWIVATGIGCALLLPVLTGLLPQWHVWTPAAPAQPSVEVTTTIVPPGMPAARPETPSGERSLNVAATAAAIWLAGTIASVGMLLVGVVRLRRITAGARLAGGDWARQTLLVAEASGIRRPIRVLETTHPGLLVTWGARRATILLPAGASQWPSGRIRLVVAHELAHIRRADWLVQIAGELLRAAYWFHPLVWLACRRLRQESECACDDAVLRQDVAGTAYAAALVALAREFSGHTVPRLPAPAITRPSTLQRRIRAMLNVHRDRRPIPLRARLVVTGALLLATVTVAAAGRQAAATFFGTVTDPSGLPVPGVTVALTSTVPEFTVRTRSDATGAFQLPVVPGIYDVEVAVPGFKAATTTVSIGPAESARRDFNLQLGTLSESITVAPGSPEPPRPSPATPAVASSPAACPQTAVGGNLRVPRKIKDVKPVYPAGSGPTAGTQVVNIDASIAPDGTVADARVVGPAAPELDAAALTAVRQWLFTPTLLNCEPVEVSMKVAVTFEPRR